MLKISQSAHYACFPAALSTILRMLICMTTRFLADFYLRTALVGQKIALR
jgi:hypothetical protein